MKNKNYNKTNSKQYDDHSAKHGNKLTHEQVNESYREGTIDYKIQNEKNE